MSPSVSSSASFGRSPVYNQDAGYRVQHSKHAPQREWNVDHQPNMDVTKCLLFSFPRKVTVPGFDEVGGDMHTHHVTVYCSRLCRELYGGTLGTIFCGPKTFKWTFWSPGNRGLAAEQSLCNTQCVLCNGSRIITARCPSSLFLVAKVCHVFSHFCHCLVARMSPHP